MSTKTDELWVLVKAAMEAYAGQSPEESQSAEARLRSAIADVVPTWRPIETAPEDAYVLCSGHEGNDPSQPRWVEKGVTNGGIWFDGNGLELYPPTHWQPLPEPPEAP